MSFFASVYQLLIGPLELLFETLYGFSKLLFGNAGLSIVLLSLTLNILLLPLYKRADAIQEEERETSRRLAPWVSHIKRTFSGDERYMMLQTYYRQNHYKPFYSLRGSLPLLLEIPFFIAAYHFLSHLPELRGTAFGPIRDLGAPDGLLRIGTLSLHLLPILMTLINAVSSAIYTKGLPARDKIQLYGMALIFLVLLYDSPAGLVFYWTLNNLFSLIKNIFGKLKNPGKVIRTGLAVLGLLLFAYALFVYRPARLSYKALLLLIALAMELPAAFALMKGKIRLKALPETVWESRPGSFFTAALFLTVLTGTLIPSELVKASPAEFVQMADFYSPLRHVFHAFLLAAGLFLVWLGIFYFLSGKKVRAVLECLLWVAAVGAVIDYMAFGTGLGNLSAELKYDISPQFSTAQKMLNLAVLLGAALLTAFLWQRYRKQVRNAGRLLIIAVLVMSIGNMATIQGTFRGLEKTAEAASETQADFTLSRGGKNVVVLMLDRAISRYLPYLFEEKPALKEAFAGFTYYPNTVSHGAYTIFGAPGLWGGYEYTPEEMNKRADESLEAKHNEALKVMPVLFDKAGYAVTVCDPTYAGYEWIPDLGIFKDYPRIRTFLTEQGQFSLDSEEEKAAQLNEVWKRNFFCYSLMKIAPVAMQLSVYQGGTYFASGSFVRWSQVENGLSQARGYRKGFLDSYAVLRALPSMTKIADGAGNNFLMLSNSTTHEPMLLKEPEYIPAETIDNRTYDEEHQDRFVLGGRRMRMETADQMAHYQSNMAALLALGQWFWYLRAEGVYDNTRIIIVADHGRDLGQFDDMKFGPEYYEDAMFFNPLLLVKDFGDQAFKTDDSFMTNADVPSLALSDLIPDARNPFTGKRISSDRKYTGPQKILFSTNIETDKNRGNVFEPGVWYEVEDNILDVTCWKRLGTY